MPVPDQVDHSLGYAGVAEAELGGPPQSSLDLGSGGGVPGLVLALCWPATRVVLVEANARRCRLLQEAIETLQVGDHVEVADGRAESLARQSKLREGFVVVTARSFGRPSVTAECGAPFLEAGGRLIVSEPPPAESGFAETRWPASPLEELSLAPLYSARFDRFGYQILGKVARSKDRYPRRVGVPTRRPLF